MSTTHQITLIPGDGTGPEVTEAVVRVLQAPGVSIDWDRQEAGVIAFQRFGASLPAELIDSVKRTKVALKGPVSTPIAEGHASVNVALRKALDLYANLRPVSCVQLVMHPERFDVLLLPNLYGDIVSDLCAGLVGGLGVVPGANLGDEVAVFEAVHGSAPDIAGGNLANPVALLLSALMMLHPSTTAFTDAVCHELAG